MIHAVPKLATVIVHIDPCDHDGSSVHEHNADGSAEVHSH